MHISQGMCLPCGVNTNQNSLLLYLQGIMSRCQGGSCMRPAALCALPWPPTTRGHTPIKWAGDLITPSCAFHPLVIHKAFLLLKRSCSACLRHQSATHCAEAAAAAAVCRAAWYANTRTTCPEYHIQYNLETPIHSNIEGRCAIFPRGESWGYIELKNQGPLASLISLTSLYLSCAECGSSYWKGMFQLLFGRRWQASRANLLNKDKVHGISQRVAYESIVRLAQIDDTDLLYMNIR